MAWEIRLAESHHLSIRILLVFRINPNIRGRTRHTSAPNSSRLACFLGPDGCLDLALHAHSISISVASTGFQCRALPYNR